MSNKICDVRDVMRVLGTRVYKILILDNMPNRVVSVFANNLLREDDLVFAGSDLGYTIRTLARGCMGEYIPSCDGYTQYIGGVIGGALKYSVRGMSNSASLLEKFVLGAINSLGYEIITDANVGITTYMVLAICLEASEPTLSHIWFITHENLYKDVVISAGVGTFISASVLAYMSTENHIGDMINNAYDDIKSNIYPSYMGAMINN